MGQSLIFVVLEGWGNGWNNMAEKVYFTLKEMAFSWLYFETSQLQAIQNLLEVVQMLIKGPPNNNHIVNVNQTTKPLKTCKYTVHQTLESGWCIAKPKGHNIKFEQSLPCAKSSLFMIFWCHFYLLVATFQVNSWKPVRPRQSIKGVIYPGKWINIFVCYRVYFPIIHAKSCSPIFLLTKAIGDAQGLLKGETIP